MSSRHSSRDADSSESDVSMEDVVDERANNRFPQAFGRYQLVRRIANGGMAEVFRAVLKGPNDFEKTVALKRMLPMFDKMAVFRQRFLDEARLVAELNHVNIVQVFDFGEVGGRAFLTMELVDGTDVGRLLYACRAADIPMPLPVAIFLIAEAARGLAHAHSAARDGKPLGIVHRDVSPQNLLVSRSGEVKIADFGIARVTNDAVARSYRTGTGAVMGKLRFMSPEQVSSTPLDARSDLFALGLLLYELITNTPPIVGDNPAAVVEQVRNASFDPPSTKCSGIPPQLDAIVAKVLARDRDARYPNGGDLGRDLARVLAEIHPGFGREELSAFVHAVLPPAEGSGEQTLPPPEAPKKNKTPVQRRAPSPTSVRRAARRPTTLGPSGKAIAAAGPPPVPTRRVSTSDLVASEVVGAGIDKLLAESIGVDPTMPHTTAKRPKLQIVPTLDEMTPSPTTNAVIEPLAPKLEPTEATILPVAVTKPHAAAPSSWLAITLTLASAAVVGGAMFVLGRADGPAGVGETPVSMSIPEPAHARSSELLPAPKAVTDSATALNPAGVFAGVLQVATDVGPEESSVEVGEAAVETAAFSLQTHPVGSSAPLAAIPTLTAPTKPATPPSAAQPVVAVAPRVRLPQLDGKNVVDADGNGATAADEGSVERARKAYARGEAMRVSGDYRTAETSLLDSLSAYPGFAPSYLALARVYAHQGNIDLATSSLSTYLESRPTAANGARARRWMAQLAALPRAQELE